MSSKVLGYYNRRLRLIQVRLGYDKISCIVKYKHKEENTQAV